MVDDGIRLMMTRGNHLQVWCTSNMTPATLARNTLRLELARRFPIREQREQRERANHRELSKSRLK